MNTDRRATLDTSTDRSSAPVRVAVHPDRGTPAHERDGAVLLQLSVPDDEPALRAFLGPVAPVTIDGDVTVLARTIDGRLVGAVVAAASSVPSIVALITVTFADAYRSDGTVTGRAMDLFHGLARDAGYESVVYRENLNVADRTRRDRLSGTWTAGLCHRCGYVNLGSPAPSRAWWYDLRSFRGAR